jgi:hypothetical protein
MLSVSKKDLEDYRAQMFRSRSGNRVKTKEEAIKFVNERGFIFFWPIKDVILPSLWTAVAGDRPVADEHDDPGHITWGWKDSLLGAKLWYYAKILRHRATIISMKLAPYFYALSENYGAPEEDYLTQYEQGKLTQEAKVIYEALLAESPLDTVQLRRRTRLTSRDSNYRFNRGLNDLQADFKILPVGVTDSGGWRYAFAYDLVSRHLPEIPDQARNIQENEARKKLIKTYLKSVGAAEIRDVSKLFGWRVREVQRTVESLTKMGGLVGDVHLDGDSNPWIAIHDFVEWL